MALKVEGMTQAIINFFPKLLNPEILHESFHIFAFQCIINMTLLFKNILLSTVNFKTIGWSDNYLVLFRGCDVKLQLRIKVLFLNS